jgi:DtxR family Mn-dependent transcriptional regulator
MERDGLLHVAGDRHLQLTEDGRSQATAVMRKHRLAERLLADVIGLDWEDVHVEACRWEHVMSDAVERRIVTMLEPPLLCPHGNPIPGLAELGVTDPGSAGSGAGPAPADGALLTLTQAGSGDSGAGRAVVVDRISEQLQPDVGTMRTLSSAGLRPGGRVRVRVGSDEIEVTTDSPAPGASGAEPSGRVLLSRAVADHVFVRPA